MAKEEPTESRVLTVLGYAAGIAAVVAGLVYVTGGVVLATRLIVAGLPFENIVGELPRQLLLSIGLTQVVLPALLIAALYGAARFVLGERWGRPEPSSRREAAVAALVGAIGLTAIGGTRVFYRVVSENKSAWVLFWLFIAVGLAAIGLAVAFTYRARAHMRHYTEWHGAREVALMTAVVMLAVLPAWLVYAASVPLVPVKVCTETDFTRASLIGETADRIYLGGSPGSPHRIIAIPADRVRAIFIGGEPYKKYSPSGGVDLGPRCPRVTGSVGSGPTPSPTLRGATGPKGATGAAGSTGARGATGLAGATGAAGSTGATGATGLAGATGATGRRGLQGATGLRGLRGRISASGRRGVRGPTGVRGRTGARGRRGARGPTGPRGPADDG